MIISYFEDGLKFTLLKNGYSYSVGMGSATNESTIKIPSTYKCRPVITIAGNGFYNCCSLESITVPEGVTSIRMDAFRNCKSLRKINIPNSIASIGHFAFYECHSLESLDIPNSVKSIGTWAFYDCSNLKCISMPDV